MEPEPNENEIEMLVKPDSVDIFVQKAIQEQKDFHRKNCLLCFNMITRDFTTRIQCAVYPEVGTNKLSTTRYNDYYLTATRCTLYDEEVIDEPVNQD